MSRKYLTKIGNNWYFNYRVPKHLKPIINKTVIQRSLRTDSYTTAKSVRDALLLEYRALEASHGINKPNDVLSELVSEINTFKVNDTHVDSVPMLGVEPASSEIVNTSHQCTFRYVSREYLKANESNKSDNQLALIRRAISNYTKFNGDENIRLNLIRRSQVIDFIESLQRDLKYKTISNQLTVLQQIWKYAYDRDWVNKRSPFEGHKLDRSIKVDSYKSFSVIQWSKLLSTLNQTESSYGRLWFTPIALMTGMRIEELAAIHTADVRLETNNRWFFHVHDENRSLKTKNAIRKIPIHDSILKAVLKLKSDSINEYLFSEVANYKTKSGAISKWFSKHKQEQVTKDRSYAFHSIRGMFATACENASVDERITAWLMGHSRKGVSLSYGIYSSGVKPEILSSEIDKIGEHLADLIHYFPSQ